jgi:hypothetical protein
MRLGYLGSSMLSRCAWRGSMREVLIASTFSSGSSAVAKLSRLSPKLLKSRSSIKFAICSLLSTRLNNNRHVPCVVCGGGSDGDLDVLAENRQKLHQPSNRHGYRPAAHQRRDLGLCRAKQLGGLGLGELLLLDQLIDLYSELGLEEFLLRIRRPRSAKTLPLLIS